MTHSPNLVVTLAAFLTAFFFAISFLSWCVLRIGRGRTKLPTAVPFPSNSWPQRCHLGYLTAAFLAFVIYGSLVPLNFRSVPLSLAVRQFAAIPWLHLGIESRADWVANILLFIPLGFLSMGALNMDRQPGRNWWWSASVVALSCLALSIALECTQIWFPPRTVSQNDIAAETIGAVCGVVLWILVGPISTKWIRRFSIERQQRRQIEWLLVAYLIGLLIYSVLPLDLTISPGELYRKYRDGKIVLVPLSDLSLRMENTYAYIRDVATFVPVGMLATMWNRPKDRPLRPLNYSLGLGLMVVGLIETAQIFVYSRYTSTTDLLFGMVGITVGVWAMQYSRRHDPLGQESARETGQTSRFYVWAGLSVAYLIALLLIFCWPRHLIDDSTLIRERYEAFWSVPFTKLYWGSEFNAVSQVLKRCLLFAVMGSLLAFAVGSIPTSPLVRRILLLCALVAVSVLGFTIEMAQVLMPPYVPDITDVLLYIVGTAIGMTLTNRIRQAKK